MSFKPFDIFTCKPPGWNEPHPCVIVSGTDRADRKSPLEVLMCSSQRTSRAPGPGEILLDQADGLDWPTVCKCDLIVSMSRDAVKQRRGAVTAQRRGALLRKIISAHGWSEILAG